jgi:hypothetical protein
VQKDEKARTKQRYDDNFATKFHYNIGDKVWLNVMAYKKGACRKLEPKWRGPYVVVSRQGEVNYSIKLLDSNKPEELVHQARLKRAYMPDDTSDDSMPELEADDDDNDVIMPAQPPALLHYPQPLTLPPPPPVDSDEEEDWDDVVQISRNSPHVNHW